MKTYTTLCFKDKICLEKVPVGKVEFFNWENENPYRPNTEFQLCFLEKQGIFVKMKTDEKSLRSICKGRDEPCWEDSCMEFFFLPFSYDDGYINFEINPKGAYLSAFGKDRNNRVFLKDITSIEPEIKTSITDNGWELTLFIPCKLIEDVFKKEFFASCGNYKGNFFKCGDKTEKPHYGSFSPMGSLPPGFHNPHLFANFSLKEEI